MENVIKINRQSNIDLPIIRSRKSILEVTKRRVTSAMFALVAVCLLRIFLFSSIFTQFGVLEIIFDPLCAVIVLCGMLSAWRQINKKIRSAWICMMFFIAIAYLLHPSAGTHICNLTVFLGVLTLLPFTDLKHADIKWILSAYVIYVLIIAFLGPKFGEDASNSIININTNLSSTIMLCFFIIILTKINFDKKNKLLYLILLIIPIICIISFKGRSSIVSVLMIVIYFLGKKFFDRIKPNKIGLLVVALCVFSVIFAYVYSTVLVDLFGSNIVIFGKNLFTGRQSIWAPVFERFDEIGLFGYGNRFDVGYDYLPSMHNVMLTMLVDFGCIATFFYVILLALIMTKLGKILKSKFLIAFILIFLLKTIFEGDFLADWTISHICISIILIFSFSKKRANNLLTTMRPAKYRYGK